MKISVATTATIPEGNDVTYDYTVSGGKIIGSGADVVWDLQDVKPGVYTITVGIDDGGGVFGQNEDRVNYRQIVCCLLKKIIF